GAAEDLAQVSPDLPAVYAVSEHHSLSAILALIVGASRCIGQCRSALAAPDLDLALALARLQPELGEGRRTAHHRPVLEPEPRAVPGAGDHAVLDLALGERPAGVGAGMLHRVNAAGLAVDQHRVTAQVHPPGHALRQLRRGQ